MRRLVMGGLKVDVAVADGVFWSSGSKVKEVDRACADETAANEVAGVKF